MYSYIYKWLLNRLSESWSCSRVLTRAVFIHSTGCVEGCIRSPLSSHSTCCTIMMSCWREKVSRGPLPQAPVRAACFQSHVGTKSQ